MWTYRFGSFNGLQLVISGDKRIPAIVITGYADSVLEAEARRGGAEYLVKPFDPDRLMSLIRTKLAAMRLSHSPCPAAGAARPSPASPRRSARSAGTNRRRGLGGVKFEIRPVDEEAVVPQTFQLRLSNDMSLQADLVWKNMLNDEMWVCGAAVWPEESSARQWFGLVDTST